MPVGMLRLRPQGAMAQVSVGRLRLKEELLFVEKRLTRTKLGAGIPKQG